MACYHLRVEFGLRYAYFGNTSTALMDKLSFYVDRSIELGGEVRIWFTILRARLLLCSFFDP